MRRHYLSMLPILAAGCSNDARPPTGGNGAGGGGGAPIAVFSCPDVANTWPMVLVPRAKIGAFFCIDSREVTNEQYGAFLNSDATPTLNPECAAVTDFTPKSDWPPAADRKAHPVGAVTWCDANAFCLANGKRMCGDENGALMTFSETDKEAEFSTRPTEMWLACTRGGEQTYVYGDEGDAGRCNDTPLSPEDVLPADTETMCEGGYDGIFFLQGNALEWEGGCKWESSNEGLSPAFCIGRGSGGCMSQYLAWGNGEAPLDWHREFSIRCCADAIASD